MAKSNPEAVDNASEPSSTSERATRTQYGRKCFPFDQAEKYVAGCIFFLGALSCYWFVGSVINDIVLGVGGVGWIDAVGGLIFGLGMSQLCVVMVFYTSNVVIDEDGIGSMVFGKVWNRILWTDVKQIRAATMPNLWAEPFDSFQFDRAVPGPPFGKWGKDKKTRCVLVVSKIQGIRELLDIVNIYVEKYNIPIVDHRPGKDPRPEKIVFEYR